MENSDVYETWDDEELVVSCLKNISCVNTAPALAWLKGQLYQFESAKRRFTVSAVDISTGEYVSFNQDNTAFEDIPQAALSSSSIPGAFPPQSFQGHFLMDGGTVWNVDPVSAIHQCLEIVDSEEDIILDIAICYPS